MDKRVDASLGRKCKRPSREEIYIMAIYVKRRDETASPPQRETGEIDGCKLVSKETVGRIDDVVDGWNQREKTTSAAEEERKTE